MQWSKTKHAENTMLELQLRSKGRLRRDVAKRGHMQSGSIVPGNGTASRAPRAAGARAQGCRVVSAPPYPQSGRKAGWGGMAEGCKDQQEDERRNGIAGIPYAPDHCVHQGKRSVKLSSSQLPRAYKSCVRCSSTVLAATASRYVRSVAACAHLPRSCISENAMP